MNKARVTEAHRTNFTVKFDNKEYLATVRGSFHEDGDFPKVGDYVSLDILDSEKAVITEVLPRETIIKRKAASSDEEQIIATNVDLIFIVMGLDNDFNLARLERYLLLVKQSGINAVVVLNKSDLSEDVEVLAEETRSLAGEVSVMVVSALTGFGMGELSEMMEGGKTAVLLGSSGAGKSTITNWLLGENLQEVSGVREDDSRGRHTTTSRQLFELPNGGYLIDTPGMRELGVLDTDSEDEKMVFDKIENFASLCRFRDCDHEKSAGCAVLEALENGDITERELNNYHKIIKEREFRDTKGLKNTERFNKQNDKRRQQQLRAIIKRKLSQR